MNVVQLQLLLSVFLTFTDGFPTLSDNKEEPPTVSHNQNFTRGDYYKDPAPTVIHKSADGKMWSRKTLFGGDDGFIHPADVMDAVQKSIDRLPKTFKESVNKARKFFSYTVPEHSKTFFGSTLPRVFERFLIITDPKSYDTKGNFKVG